MARMGILDGTTVALLGIDKWQFLRPIFIGDTIHVRVTILDKRETSNPTQGVVLRKCELINQHGEVVQQGEMPVMIKRKL
jgi:acyl dehydratase